MSERPAPDECAVCGAEIPANARACPECGADERNGWREQDMYDGLDLPDDASGKKATGAGAVLFWKIVCIVLLVLMVALAVSVF